MNNRRDFLKKMMAGTAAAIAAPSLLAADSKSDVPLTGDQARRPAGDRGLFPPVADLGVFRK